MRKKYSIGFLLSFIFFTMILVCAYQFTYDRALRRQKWKKEQVVRTEGNARKESSYWICAKGDYVIVYLDDQKTVYEYTSIFIKDLPEEIQKQIRRGKNLHSIREVYGFLENYSS